MTQTEQEQLTLFLQQLKTARLSSKDAEAERLIREACAGQPDALYLLVQRSLLLGQAVDKAQAEISRLQQAVDAASRPAERFLDPNAWGNTSIPAATPTPMPRTGLPANASVGPVAAAPGNSMFGQIASTAAGVVAGAFLFQGIEHLLGHPAGSGLLSGHAPSSEALLAPAEEVPPAQYADAGDFADLGPVDGEPEWM